MVNSSFYKSYFLFVLIFLSLSSVALAQEDAFDANFQISQRQGGETKSIKVQYARFKTENKANTVRKILEEAIIQQRGDKGSAVLDAWDKAIETQKIKFRYSKENGEFRVHGYADEAILISTYDPEDELSIEDVRFAVIKLKENEIDYSYTFERKVGEGTNKIPGTDVIGKHREEPIDITIEAPEGDPMCFPITVFVPANYFHDADYTRLIIQPMLVDCQTEDTVCYLPMRVYEGEKYHELQTKQMAFDYKNDDVSKFYHGRLWREEPFSTQYTECVSKPDKERNYKCCIRVVLSDLNHVYTEVTQGAKSCNRYDYLKLLDLTDALADLDVREFHVDADGNYETKNQDLKLEFVVGKAELTKDSTNIVQLEELTSELKSYGDLLQNVTVTATASPEGGLESNKRLALARTIEAEKMMRARLGNADVTFHRKEPQVYTWETVASLLEQNGDTVLANAVRKSMGPDGYGGDVVISSFPDYDIKIVPILEKLRIMRVTYRYEHEHIMSENEVVAAYTERKTDLLQGKGKDFSDGDYYNLFLAIKDSLEQDTLTMLAYSHIIKTKEYEKENISMYIANRMALLSARRNRPDLSYLAPFLDLRNKQVYKKGEKKNEFQNRMEILLNQLVLYAQLGKMDTASALFDRSLGNLHDSDVTRARHYINFKKNFSRHFSNQLTSTEEKQFEEDMEFVLNSSIINKAVVLTEARKKFEISKDSCYSLLNGIPDDKPTKWYLYGILKAEEYEENNSDVFPEYLAVFNHCFELDFQYKWHYFSDAQISDDLRSKNMYDRRMRSKYRSMFSGLLSKGILNNQDSADKSDDLELSGGDDE